MEKRSLPLNRIILSFVIATILFISIFLVSYAISYSKYESIVSNQEDIYYNLLSIELEKELIVSSCDFFNSYYISRELEEMGSIINILEERFGKKDEKVIKQKEIYSMLEIQHFNLIKEHNKICNKTIPTILFFYSNEENFVDSAEKKGYMLDSLKKINKDIMIYSFDYDLDNNLINILKKKYNIDKPNLIIMNEKHKIEELQNINELVNYLKLDENLSLIIKL